MSRLGGLERLGVRIWWVSLGPIVELSGGEDHESDVDDKENTVEMADVLQDGSGIDTPIPCKGDLLGDGNERSQCLACSVVNCLMLRC